MLVYDRLSFNYIKHWNKKCRSSLKTNVFNRDNVNAVMVVLTNNDNHNHPQEDTSIADAEGGNMMRNAIVQQPTVPVKRIYNEPVVHLHQDCPYKMCVWCSG